MFPRENPSPPDRLPRVILSSAKDLCGFVYPHAKILRASPQLGFLFWGVAGAFLSGTEEELIYDNLKRENREGEFKEEGRATVLSIYSSAQNAVMILFSLVYACSPAPTA